MKMPFGKHKGEELENLPTDYIEWLLSNVELKEHLEEELQNQLTMRRGEGVAR